ncbi:MAG TPA: SPFH domain-containing protein [Parcubacteria group bacterium]|nr:SPFH domain-containing protein [Parcubacteria group bacterium]
MQDTGGLGITTFVIPTAILLLAVVTVIVVRFLIKQYNRVSPNTVAVVYGKRNGEKGYRIVTGGGFFLWPVIEEVKYLSLNIMSIEVAVVNAPDKNGVLLSVKGVANVKIRSQTEHLPAAIERFLGKSEEEIKRIAKDNLEGNLRALTGTLTVEELIQDRTKFQAQVLQQVGADMAKLGLDIDLLNIQNITDDKGYIDSLGRKQTAGIHRDAEIGEAEARRETAIKTAEARQAGEIATSLADQKVSDAHKQRDMAVAENKAQVEAAQARISIVSQAAAAAEQKKLNIATVEAEQAQVEAEIGLQESVRKRTEAKLNATTIVEAEKGKEAKIIAAEAARRARVIEAEATKEARIIEANADQEASVLEGEASRIKSEKEGLGAQARMTAEAAGRVKVAEATRAEKEAEAAGRKALLLAEAEGEEARLMATARGTQATLMAEADGRKALLLAEAEGAEKKAAAFAKLDEASKAMLILEHLPAIIGALGDAASKVIVPAAEAIGEGLGNVKEIRLVSMGGQNGSVDGNVLSQFMKAPSEALFGLFQRINAAGLGPMVKSMLSKYGIDVSDLFPEPAKLAGGSEVPATAAPLSTSKEGSAKVGSK